MTLSHRNAASPFITTPGKPLPPLWGKVGMGGAAARAIVVDLGGDHLPDTIHISEDFVVPESQDPIALAAHEVITPLVVSARFGVLTTVDLDDEHRFQASEVGNVRSDANLATELVAFELPEAQVLPEPTLGVRHVLAKTSCALVCHGAAAGPHPPKPPHTGAGGLRVFFGVVFL